MTGVQTCALPILRQISSRICEDWAARRSPQVAASTYNNERDTIIAILEYGRREGLILDNPAKVLQRRKQPRTEIVVPTKEEFATLVRTLRTTDHRSRHAAGRQRNAQLRARGYDARNLTGGIQAWLRHIR